MLVIAIDGTAGSGKSILGRRLAERLGYRYIDSGAMYRAVGWAALQRGIDLDDAEALTAMADSLLIEIEDGNTTVEPRIILDGVDVSEEIRSPEASLAASRVGTIPGVRRAMVALQRKMGRDGGIVMEGRDIGTAVFPGADVKFYLDASLRVRAERRRLQQLERGTAQLIEQVEKELSGRDDRDSSREMSPLRPAHDAVVIDTSEKDLEQLEAEMMAVIDRALQK